MIAFGRMGGLRPKGHKIGKGLEVYKGMQAVQVDSF